ncbi:a disintegrin and metalloproteinase with thrombospondin motifs 16 [Trichonephila clavata]|uniref:A disintegrin and metalloproteinase with thrombospondin motifs 16 n=1 Tax=Trichonephila clavata TaxID=2740835 RepID=A0A8X6HZK7_TRICU|nr:a disintegrin and metalloproteinase with thrombospondin motifs 16 [Trichonephila clavata]
MPCLSPDTNFSHIEIVESPLLRFQDTNKTENHKHRRKLQLHLNSLGEKFYLDLWKNPSLSTSLLYSHTPHMKNKSCFYHGKSVQHKDSSVAISLCDGVRGFIQTADASYAIQPLPEQVVQRLDKKDYKRPHIVVRREISPDTFCPHALRKHNQVLLNNSNTNDSEPEVEDMEVNEKNETSAENKTRERRSTASKSSSIIETAVFIDQALYDQMRRTFPSDTDRQMTTFVLTMMNAVQRLFQHSSLGKSPEIRLVLMETLKQQPQELRPSDNIDTYLTNFCIWQHNRRHYGRGKSPRWDHALLLSGINMYVVDESGRRKRHVVGLAPVSGMCNPLNSCTISEGTSFQTVLVAAHEMGHSLGMEHDGHQDGNHCDSDTYVMSPTLGAGKTTWSSCSKQYLEKFLRFVH